MSTTEVVDAVLRLLAIVVSWPLVLLVVVIIVRRELPRLLVDLAQRVRKAPGGFEFDQLRDEVASVAQRVKRIEDAVVIRPSAALTPDVKQQLQDSLYGFYEYFKALGYEPGESPPEVTTQSNYPNAHYDGSQNLIVIGESLLGDVDVALREYAHHVLTAIVPLREYGAIRQQYRAIESGLADYFPCSFTNDALMGEQAGQVLIGKPYIRNLDNERKFTEVPSEGDAREIAPQVVGEIWGGAFWEMRKLLQQEVADRLLFSAWNGQSLADITKDDPKLFVSNLIDEARQSADGSAVDTVRSVFQRRGLEA
jgi:hypothetical protein